MESLANYPGNKGASGFAEAIIGQMPQHQIYVEGFAGSAAVFRRKRAAEHSILIDADPAVTAALSAEIAGSTGADVVTADFLVHFESYRWNVTRDTLLYLDPPYLRSVRSRLLYDFEFATAQQHALLLDMILILPCLVMISGYDSPLYRKRLRRWRVVEIPTMTRGGKRVELVWCNFPPPTLLHDPRFAGAGYRQRENIKRKQKRWSKKFAGMAPKERQAVAVALAGVDRAAVESALRSATAVPPQ